MKHVIALLLIGTLSGCGSEPASDIDDPAPLTEESTIPGSGEPVVPVDSGTTPEEAIAAVDSNVQDSGNTQESPIAQVSPVVELDIGTLQRRRAEIAPGTSVKVTGGVISRIFFGEPTRQGPRYSISLHKHAFGINVYEVECRFDGPDAIADLVEDQAVTVQGVRADGGIGIDLVDCQIIDRGEVPQYAARGFDAPIAESNLEFPEEPEGIRLKTILLPYELDIAAEAFLEDGSLPADYLDALANSLVVRHVTVTGDISNAGLKQIAALRGMKKLTIDGPSGFDVEKFDVSGLDFSLLADHPRLRTLSLQDVVGITDDTLIQIGQLQCLANLELNWAATEADISDGGLAGLASLQSLRRVKLPHRGEIQITDDGLTALGKLPYLQELSLESDQVTGRGLAALSHCEKFEILQIFDGPVTTEGLASLRELPHLRSLTLHRTEVDDGLAPIIAGMSQLEELDLQENEITDAFFENWGPPPQLTHLNLAHTNLTDRGVELLCDNPPKQLLHLDLRNRKEITAATVPFISRIGSLKELVAPSSYSEEDQQSLRDRGLFVR